MKLFSCFQRVAEAPHALAFLIVSVFAFSAGTASGASPAVTTMDPKGGQRGTELQVTVTGNQLWDAEEIVFHEPGITWKNIEPDPKDGGRFFKVTLAIAPDAHLGEHTYRVRTKSGLSYARRFWVSQFPNVMEVATNNDFETPQVVPLNSTIEGSAKPETVDYFQVSAKKGQRISVEVEGLRANPARGEVGIDPYVAILDKNRFEIVAVDDTPLLRQDCFVSTIAPEDGDYVILVRDASYQGNAKYRAHIGTFPRPSAIYPAGGPAGTEIEVTALGDQRGPYKQKVKLPGEPTARFPFFAAQDGLEPPSPNLLRVSAYGNVLEDESINDSMGTMKESSGTLPLAFNGILQEEGDMDYFRFTAKKGQKFRIVALAKAFGSPVDPVLHLFDVAGKLVGGNDDADNSADARYDFTAAEDGDYFIRVYDHLKRGGPDYVYRVETEGYEPELVVSMPEFQRFDNQFRKSMDIPRGGRFATVVNVTRRNVRADAGFEFKGLPPGVVAKVDTLPADVTQFPIVFEAGADAPLGTSLGELWAVTVGQEKAVRGRYTQELDWVRANPVNTLYYATESPHLPVTVCEEAPFTLELLPPEKPLLRDGEVEMKVIAKRQPGFTKPITVRWLWRPPGISCNSTATIAEGKNETVFSLTCNDSAPVRTWKVCVMGEGNAGRGLVFAASDLVDLPVADHFTKMEMQLATVVQGGKSEVVISVEEIRALPGVAQVKLLGVPAKTKTSEVTLKPGDKEVRVALETEPDAPVGQHKNVFCELSIDDGGVIRTQRAGMGGIIRIDPKPKEPVTKPAETKTVASTEKPLSRLEQLRLEAANQAKASNP